MNFYSVRELRSDSKAMWQNLAAGSEIVITNNGKPSALMIDIPEGGFGAEKSRGIRLGFKRIVRNGRALTADGIHR